MTSMFAAMGLVLYLELLPKWLPYTNFYVPQFIATTFFVWLYITCRQKYLNVYQRRYATVDARFKTQINFTASRLFLRLAPYKLCVSLANIMNYQFLIDHSLYVQTFFTYIEFFQISLQVTIHMWLIISCDHELRKRFVRMLNSKATEVQDLRSAVGEKISFTIPEESDIYFRELRTMWR
ncbi:unnamed protein product, partial [Mesorhabditis spiculigera]